MKKTIIAYAFTAVLLGSANLAAQDSGATTIKKDFGATCSAPSDISSRGNQGGFYFSGRVNLKGSESFLTEGLVGKSQVFENDPGEVVTFKGIDYLDIDKKDVEVTCRYTTNTGVAVTLIAQFPDDIGKSVSFVEYTKGSQKEPMKLHYEGPALKH